MKTKQGNKLIAEFMGFKIGKLTGWISGTNEYAYTKKDKEIVDAYSLDKLKYDSSWDWLVPVCYKLSNLFEHNCWSVSVYKQYMKHAQELDRQITLYEIKHIYPIVVEFIKWYNKNKN